MKKLIYAIGKAPSEMSDEELYSLLSKERARMGELHFLRKGGGKAKKSRRKRGGKLTKKELQLIAEKAGISLESLIGR